MAIKKVFRVLWVLQISMLLTLVLCAPGICGQDKLKKKVLFVNSYDIDNNWALGTLKGALKVLKVRMNEDTNLDDSSSPVDFKLYNMKTKRNNSEAYKKKAALEVKGLIDSWHPDVVICADDNASKYLIVPYFKETEIPFVFCGVNWSAAAYGFPCSNVTGIIEVFPVQEVLNILGPHAKGKRMGFLSHDTMTERKNARYIREIFKIDLVERFVSSLDEFETSFQEIQQNSDMLMIIAVVSMEGFDYDRFLEITDTHTIIPTASFTSFPKLLNSFLLTCRRVPEEQGEWAATAAMEILDGKSPADIPIGMNQKAAVRLNMNLAKRLGIKFPMELIERAKFVSEEGQ